jgi:hypothetical protein
MVQGPQRFMLSIKMNNRTKNGLLQSEINKELNYNFKEKDYETYTIWRNRKRKTRGNY